MLTDQEMKDGLRYFTVTEEVTQVYVYNEVKAKSRREAESIVQDGKAGNAKHTYQKSPIYQVL